MTLKQNRQYLIKNFRFHDLIQDDSEIVYGVRDMTAREFAKILLAKEGIMLKELVLSTGS